MSVLQCSDALMASDIQIWNNAAFVNDHGDSNVPTDWSLKPDLVNLSQSMQSDDCSKENRRPNTAIVNPQDQPLNVFVRQSSLQSLSPVSKGIDRERSGLDIDAEIEEIEMEISRLKFRLESLRLEKSERDAKTIERRRGRVVPAKFMEQRQIVAPKLTRRGVSMGPAEIASSFKARPLSKAENTPIPSVQSRRKSCFWKIQEIDELKSTKERRKSLSNSPTSRKTAAKILQQRQALTTIASKKGVKKEEGVMSSIQPKKLFKEGEKSAPDKKLMKPGRIIASRYNQISASAARKRSWPENEKEEGERFDKKRVSQGPESKGMKKRWEIPSELVLYKSEEEDKNTSSSDTPLTVGKLTEVLPKIRTVRCGTDTPRDSGHAKRVSDLVGRRGYFDESEGEQKFVQKLSFIEDDEECGF